MRRYLISGKLIADIEWRSRDTIKYLSIPCITLELKTYLNALKIIFRPSNYRWRLWNAPSHQINCTVVIKMLKRRLWRDTWDLSTAPSWMKIQQQNHLYFSFSFFSRSFHNLYRMVSCWLTDWSHSTVVQLNQHRRHTNILKV